MPRPRKDFRRSPDQLKRDRALTAGWAAQQFSSEEISKLLKKETGYEISARQIRADLAIIRKEWMETQHDNYQMMINEELQRLDSLEREAWKAWRETKEGVEEIQVIEDYRNAVELSVRKGEDVKAFTQRMKRTIKPKAPVVAFLQMIHAIQQERRKVLGLYAPGQLGISIDSRKEVLIKAYKNVSPDDWDDGTEDMVNGIIESEFIDNARGN